METNENHSARRQTVINGLAIAGFISLMLASMWLAVAATRFVPVVADRVGAAAVYLGSVFTPSPTTPTATSTATTTPVAATSTPASATSTPTKATPAKPETITPTAGKETTNTYQIGGPAATPTLHGLPDLTVSITAVGYLATTSAQSFIASSTVPAGSRPAVKFTVKNIGTNVSGAWTFSANIPTATSYLYMSQPQQSLAPGDSIDYTLGFDQSSKGSDKKITITVNASHTVAESNTMNDVASTTITVLGS